MYFERVEEVVLLSVFRSQVGDPVTAVNPALARTQSNKVGSVPSQFRRQCERVHLGKMFFISFLALFKEELLYWMLW